MEIRSLNKYERESIEKALQEYIANHPDNGSWSQKIILNDMLPCLMWISKES